MPQQRVGAEGEDHQDQRDARRAPRRLEHQEHDRGADRDPVDRALDELGDELRIPYGDVETTEEPRGGRQDVVPRNDALGPPPAGHEQEGEREARADRRREELLGVQGDAERGRQTEDPEDDEGRERGLEPDDDRPQRGCPHGVPPGLRRARSSIGSRSVYWGVIGMLLSRK